MTISLIAQFIFAALATCGFSIIFKVPAGKTPVCCLVGAIGWIIYQLTVSYGFPTIMACFLGACAVALLSDIFSKALKEAATVFIIPGIMCLVPGAGMYNTMLALLNNDMDGFAAIGTQTLMAAGAIAVGLLVVGSLLRIIKTIIKKCKKAVS